MKIYERFPNQFITNKNPTRDDILYSFEEDSWTIVVDLRTWDFYAISRKDMGPYAELARSLGLDPGMNNDLYTFAVYYKPLNILRFEYSLLKTKDDGRITDDKIKDLENKVKALAPNAKLGYLL